MKDLRTKTEVKLNADKMSWANARKVCQSWGGDLADMEDAAMHTAVAELLAGGTGGWTGAIRDGAEWKWASSTARVTIGTPEGDAGDCALTTGDANAPMTAADCADEKEFVCRRPTHVVHKYAYNRNKASWADAKAACEAGGYQLAAVRSASEQGKIRRMINGSQEPVWIGGNNENTANGAW